MFNQDLKSEFIRQYTDNINTVTACKSIFNHFEPYEKKWNADLCTRTAQELQPAIDTIIGMRYQSQTRQLIILQKYIKWCVRNGVKDAIDDIQNINEPGVEKIRQSTVSGPQQLQQYLDIVYLPEKEDTVDNTYRAFYWLAFSGMKEEDIINVTANDLDFMNMCINYNGKSYPIYGEAVPSLMRCATAVDFVYIHPKYSTRRTRVEGTSLVRGIRGTNSVVSFRTHLSRSADNMIEKGKITKNISYYRTWLSGVFYNMYLRELSGDIPDFTNLVSEKMQGKEYKLDRSNYTLKSIHKKTILDYQRDYERWKFAHEL